jgi:acyl-coenzyme A thioesterase PaaI-like protein
MGLTIMTEKLPDHGSCFVCGKTNPKSIGVEWELGPECHIVASFRFNEYQQGPPGFVHGGASAAVLDEAMGSAVWQAGYRAATVHLELDYRKPIPIGEEIRIEGWLFSKENDSVTARGIIYLSDGIIAVEARAKYVNAPQLFKDVPFAENHSGFDSPASLSI